MNSITPVEVDGWDTAQIARTRYGNTPAYSLDALATAPADWTGSVHVGDGVWASRCICHGDTFATYGTVPRWASPCGKHEAAHGQQVAGINVGILA